MECSGYKDVYIGTLCITIFYKYKVPYRAPFFPLFLHVKTLPCCFCAEIASILFCFCSVLERALVNTNPHSFTSSRSLRTRLLPFEFSKPSLLSNTDKNLSDPASATAAGCQTSIHSFLHPFIHPSLHSFQGYLKRASNTAFLSCVDCLL